MMYSFRQHLIAFFFAFFLLICIVHSSQNDEEDHANAQHLVHDQAMTAARLHALKQILSRRGLYDPAFGDSWSNYLERKRALFDPAYGDWANSFKRSDE